ncbi:MAG TPA: zf-HC2 domain-containing protein [Vicinamibacteria bacterium]|nr:zf-HC2 domain-containing protein [Vicinamibacteria bacterium]
MSDHERERLSAYLDGELEVAERAAVQAHLAACAECAAFLADLAAIDAEASGLPADAPEGYFERFPSKVMARLEMARRPWRPPVWTWAAAAALLLVVVTPLTLRERRAPASQPPAPEASAVPRTAPLLHEGRGPVAPQQESKAARPQPLGAPFAVAPLPRAAKSAPRENRAPGPEREKKEAEAPREVLGRRGTVQVDALTTADTLSAGARREEPLADSIATPETVGGPPPPARSAAAPAAASLESSARAAGLARPAPALDEEGRAFRRLDVIRPASVEEWRRLREAWLAFAAAHPGDRRADEARVRAIEAGHEAWLAGGDESDGQAFRRDAAAYLAAAESLQKPRVERLLASPRP